MGVQFTVLSLSEAEPAYRSIIQANHGSVIQQMFTDVSQQVSDYAGQTSPDVGVTGSPCNPFSSQRAKRWVEGDVACHKDFQTTMTSVIQFYANVEPKLGITEQVSGFNQPFSQNNRQTPLQQLLG